MRDETRSLSALHQAIDKSKGLCRVMVVVLAAHLALAGCSKRSAFEGQIQPLAQTHFMAKAAEPEEEANTLSRTHAIAINVSESDLEARFRSVSDHCVADKVHHCTILQSELASSNRPSGHIKLRIDPPAVEEFFSFVTSQGRLESRSTSIEDLAEAIQDTQTHISMLLNYRKQLLALQAKAATNIDAAVKIASELSTVQSDLERATGEAAFQTKRTTTDIVSIEFVVAAQTAFLRPIREAAAGFFGNLSMGLSQAITAIAFIVPWLIVVLPGLYLLRFLWRRRGK
jgi:hypothetical protein